MLSDYIALLPEFIITMGILCMLMVKVFHSQPTPRIFFEISRTITIIGMIATAIFYNHSITWVLNNNLFTTLFKLLIYGFTFAWSCLSYKHFANKSVTGFHFYGILLFNLICFSLAISSQNLLILWIGLSFQFLNNNILFKIEKDSSSSLYMQMFAMFSIFFVIVFAVGVGIFYYYAHTFDYGNIERILGIRTQIILPYRIAFGCIIFSFLFMMGIAPLHFWFAGATKNTPLPVAGYLTIIPIFGYFACLVNICANAFYPLLGWFNKVFIIFGLLSIFLGSIGANSEKNLRKIFAYGALYYLGVTVLALFPLTNQGLVSAFTYLLVYIIAMFGIYTVFYGYCSKGVYMSELDDIKGIATQRPFLSAALLIFMISLIGTPPLLGFLGRLSVINSLIIGHHLALIGAELVAMIMLVYAYLKIINVVYFEPRNNVFDGVNRGIYICLLINIILILIAVINPKYLMHDVELMLVEVFS